jgi:hypothetical protein
MAVKAINFKKWCVENISPQCWPRILLKSMDELRADGFQLKELEEPTEEMILSPELLDTLNKALQAIYDIQVEEGVL